MIEKTEKLQKVLARAGHGSRREIESLIAQNRISVDGAIAKLGDRIDANVAKVRIDGRQVRINTNRDQVCRVLVYNKPEGELSTRRDPEGRRTVFERLPHLENSRWISIGRLDVNTSGLLLFTTDGELANRLMHPKSKIEREYMVRVFGEVTDTMIQNLVEGVDLEDGHGKARFEDVVYTAGEGMNHTFYVVISEGRNREVRRLWASQGLTVSRLKRVRYGSIFLEKDLPKGGWKELSLKEVNYLREMVELPPENTSLVDKKIDKYKTKRKDARKIKRAVRRFDKRRNEEGAPLPITRNQQRRKTSHKPKTRR